MPNGIKYNTSAESLALKRGNFYIATGDVGCCACRAGGAINGAVEFANVGLCSGSSTAALRPFINNANWGGIGSTVGAATQTLTLRFY